MAERSANNTLWLPVAAGLMGAGLALLFAPRSGRETRDKLRENIEDFKDRADGKLAVAREKVDNSLEEAKALKGRLAEAVKKDSSSKAKDSSDSSSQTYGTESTLPNWEGEA